MLGDGEFVELFGAEFFDRCVAAVGVEFCFGVGCRRHVRVGEIGDDVGVGV